MPPLTLKEAVLGDLAPELQATRDVLARLPSEWFATPTAAGAWTLGQLAQHTVEVLFWLRTVLEADHYDVTARPDAAQDAVHDTPSLLQRFDHLAAAVTQAAGALPEADLDAPWSLRQGAEVLQTQPRHMAIRRACLSHLIHHRAQLGTHLRQRGIRVPETYPG